MLFFVLNLKKKVRTYTFQELGLGWEWVLRTLAAGILVPAW